VADDTRTSDSRDRVRRSSGADREAYLREHSRLPGPRANLELLAAAVDIATPEELRRWATLTSDDAPANTPDEFLALVGVTGLGRLVVEGDQDALRDLRRAAHDPRWRLREGVAMALQRIGTVELDGLLAIARDWMTGDRYDQRAVVAGLAEPPMLKGRDAVSAALDVFDAITASVVGADDTRSKAFDALRKALAYGWSVVVAADPDIGKPRMERWLRSDDLVVRRIMRENLTKARLERADAEWVAAWRRRLDAVAKDSVATPKG
jgi:hypothetical protein